MSTFGFSTEPAQNVDFTPIIKYDSRSGRIFRVDRVNGGNGFESVPVDITAMFKAIVDFENVETGWMDFSTGGAPSFVMMPLADVVKGKPLPDKPSTTHKNGVRFLLKLNKTCGGDKQVREIAGTAKAFLGGIEEVYQEYLANKEKMLNRLPVLTLVSTTPVKSGSGDKTSTNYRPKFKIDGWAMRPDDLFHLPAEVAPTRTATAPSTGSTTVSAQTKAVSIEDDFG